jgi:hypothetical protein
MARAVAAARCRPGGSSSATTTTGVVASSLENSGSHRPLTPPSTVVAVAPARSMAWTSFSPSTT